MLLCLKHQAGLPLALLYLWRQRDWRSLIVSVLGLVTSLVCFGAWPVRCSQKILSESA